LLPSPTNARDQPIHPSEPLLHGEDVGERLTRVLTDREAVDDWDVGLGGKLHDELVGTGSCDEPVDETVEVVGDVPNAFTGAQHRLVREVDRVPPELAHACLKGDARAQARSLEEQRDGPAPQRQRIVAAGLAELRLEAGRRREDVSHLVHRQVGDAQEVTTGERDGFLDRAHPPTLTSVLSVRAVDDRPSEP
jgi:hypothetical protein